MFAARRNTTSLPLHRRVQGRARPDPVAFMGCFGVPPVITGSTDVSPVRRCSQYPRPRRLRYHKPDFPRQSKGGLRHPRLGPAAFPGRTVRARPQKELSCLRWREGFPRRKERAAVEKPQG